MLEIAQKSSTHLASSLKHLETNLIKIFFIFPHPDILDYMVLNDEPVNYVASDISSKVEIRKLFPEVWMFDAVENLG